jgi:hypothetical protein
MFKTTLRVDAAGTATRWMLGAGGTAAAFGGIETEEALDGELEAELLLVGAVPHAVKNTAVRARAAGIERFMGLARFFGL